MKGVRIIFGGENSFSEIMVHYSHPQVRIGTPKHLGVRIANNNLKKAILTPKNAVLKKTRGENSSTHKFTSSGVIQYNAILSNF